MTIRVVGDDEAASQWAEFARRFREPDSYLFGATLAFIAGPLGTQALIEGLLRAERFLLQAGSFCAAEKAFNCHEAALILLGALEALV